MGKLARKKVLKWLMGALMVFSLFAGSLANTGVAEAATTYNLNPAADTSVKAASPGSSSGGTSSTLTVASASVAYLKFDLSGVSGNVTEAKLKLYLASAPSGGYANFVVSAVGNDTWTESMTYNARPNLGGKLEVQMAVAAGWVSVNVTDFIKTQSTGDKTASLAVTHSNYGGSLSFRSRESGSNKPVLEVTTSGSANVTPYINKTLAGNKQVLVGWNKISGTLI